jgi:hypothetical protein
MAATNGSFVQQDQFKTAPEQYTATGSTEAATGTSNSSADLSKDEIGWYFVEQYYTTLSRNPEKLHVSYSDCILIAPSNFLDSSSMESAPNSSPA